MRISPVLIAWCFAALSAAARAETGDNGIYGIWLTPKHHGSVLVEACGDAVCARVLDGDALRANRAQNDVYNPDPDKRSRLIRGLRILTGYRGGPAEWEGGTVYDPQTGDESRWSTLTLLAPNRLKVEGCRLLFCRSEVWRRPQP
jgi:uncharacterized protein (DUF2147 family)